jgi:hypothetical protein
MKIGKYTPSQIRKGIVAGSGAVAILAVSAVETFTGLLSPDISAGLTSVAGIATAVGVYLARNAPIIDSADLL